MMTLYDDIMRTIIDIPESLLRDVDALARREKISRAEAVRRAMAEFLDKRGEPRTGAAFGIWKSRKLDSLGYEDSLRQEWSR